MGAFSARHAVPPLALEASGTFEDERRSSAIRGPGRIPGRQLTYPHTPEAARRRRSVPQREGAGRGGGSHSSRSTGTATTRPRNHSPTPFP